MTITHRPLRRHLLSALELEMPGHHWRISPPDDISQLHIAQEA